MATKTQGKTKSAGSGTKLICENRRARRNYDLGERFEAGLSLLGSEVKSCRAGKAHLNDAYVQIERGEAVLRNSHIAEYPQAGPYLNHDPMRPRKLLLHQQEILKLAKKIQERGYVGVPLSLYFKNGRIKLELAVGKGRAHEDKRAAVKDRESQREIQRVLRRGNR